MTGSIKIVSALDDGFAQHCGVMLCSMLTNHISSEPIDIYLISEGLSESNRRKFADLVKDRNAVIHFLDVKKEDYLKYKVDLHVSHATYFRLSIPALLAPEIEKVIYLDSDLIVIDDISKLWNAQIDFDRYCIAAAWDPNVSERPDLGLSDKERCFNAGVLLINLNKWRTQDISGQVKNFLIDHKDKVLWWDQDALNAILVGQWQVLDQRWNRISLREEQRYLKRHPAALKTYLKESSIVHFVTGVKPWNYLSVDPRDFLYFEYLQKSPWAHPFRFENKTFANMIRRFVFDRFPLPVIREGLKWTQHLREFIKGRAR